MTATHDISSVTAAEEGAVHVDGPDGVAYSMTPAAAAETGERLLDAAAEAQGQRLETARQERARRALGLKGGGPA